MTKLSLLSAKVAGRAVLSVLARPAYSLLSVLAGGPIAALITWSLNYQVLRYVLVEAPLSLAAKLRFFLGGYESLFTTFEPSQSVSIIVFSVLFGINAALLVFVVRRQSYGGLRHSGVAGAFMGVVGGGCAACGTSLLIPLLATVGLTVSASLIRTLGIVVLLLASVVTLVSIYRLGLLAATAIARKRLSQ